MKGRLQSSKEEVENYLQEVHGRKKEEERTTPEVVQEVQSAPEHLQGRETAPEDLQSKGTVPENLLEYEEPQVEYDNSLPSWHEFNSKLRKARNKSAPGPNGVPYVVYKSCPNVARQLLGCLKGLW